LLRQFKWYSRTMERVSHLLNHLKTNPTAQTHPDPDFKFQYVLITGCSRGIGLGLVEKFLEHSKYYVIATCRSPHKQHKLRAALSKYAGRCSMVPLDISNEQSIIESVGRVAAITKRIDILINNAGISVWNHPWESTLDFSSDEMKAVLATNVVGTANMVKHYIDMLKRPPCQPPSKVINMSSLLGSIAGAFDAKQDGTDQPRLTTTSYRVSKAALNMLTRIQAGELGQDYNVIVTAVNPGWVQTDMGSSQGRTPPVTLEESVDGIFSIAEKMAMDKHNGQFIDFKEGQVIPF